MKERKEALLVPNELTDSGSIPLRKQVRRFGFNSLQKSVRDSDEHDVSEDGGSECCKPIIFMS